MPLPGIKFASLDEARLKTLRALEEELGVYLLALEPDTLQIALLTPDDLKTLQAVEQELGVMLVAYQPRGSQ